MQRLSRSPALLVAFLLLALVTASGCGSPRDKTAEEPMELTHEQTLQWIRDNRAWKQARKVKPIRVRHLDKNEIGKEFQTADQAIERGQEGFVLCVGVAGEPWFQREDKVKTRYELVGMEETKFSFDRESHTYQIYKPKDDTLNWAAQVQGKFRFRVIDKFSVRPNYDMEHPLVSKAGGYVVRDDAPDPYKEDVPDVWLVQQVLFESTYEFVP
jgi:hypothetical protein